MDIHIEYVDKYESGFCDGTRTTRNLAHHIAHTFSLFTYAYMQVYTNSLVNVQTVKCRVKLITFNIT